MADQCALSSSARDAARSTGADANTSHSHKCHTQAPYLSTRSAGGDGERYSGGLRANHCERDASTPSYRWADMIFEWQDYVQMCVKVSAEVAAVVLQCMEKYLKKNPISRTDIGIGVSAGSTCYSRISSLCIALTSSMSSSESDGTTGKAECLDNVNDGVARPVTPGSARRLYASNLANMAHNLDDTATLDRSRLHERSAIADRTGEGVRCRPLPPERLLPLETGEYNTQTPPQSYLPGSQSSQSYASLSYQGSNTMDGANTRSGSLQGVGSGIHWSKLTAKSSAEDGGGDDEDDGDDEPVPSDGDHHGVGFCCIFCTRNGQPQPTDACAYNRPFTSKLRIHHFNSHHPGGPFGCCPKCYSIGEINNAKVFERFISLPQVNKHKRTCTSEICIDEHCHNYNKLPLLQPCQHPRRQTQLQIWRMWYRRAHRLDRDDPVPEPFLIGSTPALSRLQVPPTSRRGRSTSLPAPLNAAKLPDSNDTAFWNKTDPSLLMSPSGEVPTLVSTQGPSQASISSSSEALLEMTHDLLSRVQEEPRKVTNVMRNMHADAMRASGRLLQRLSADDTETLGHIERLQTLLNECWRLIDSPNNRNLNAWRDLRSAAGLVGIRLYSDVPQSWQHLSHHDQQLMPFISHLGTSDIISQESQEIPQMMQPHSENPEPDLSWPPIIYPNHPSPALGDIMRSFIQESSTRGTYNPFNLNNAPL